MTLTDSVVIARRLPPLTAVLFRYGYKAAALLDLLAAPVVMLGIRLWMANLFFKSGLTKVADWEQTKLLFEFEYMVPMLPPELAATIASGFELVMPVLLVLGLFTRVAAVPLLAMAMVIQFSLGAVNAAYDNTEHYYWMILLVVLIARGAGPLSLDAVLARFLAQGRRATQHHRRPPPAAA